MLQSKGRGQVCGRGLVRWHRLIPACPRPAALHRPPATWSTSWPPPRWVCPTTSLRRPLRPSGVPACEIPIAQRRCGASAARLTLWVPGRRRSTTPACMCSAAPQTEIQRRRRRPRGAASNRSDQGWSSPNSLISDRGCACVVAAAARSDPRRSGASRRRLGPIAPGRSPTTGGIRWTQVSRKGTRQTLPPSLFGSGPGSNPAHVRARSFRRHAR